VKAVVEACRLRAIQLHGDEKPEDWQDAPVPVIKTIKLPPGHDDRGLPEYKIGERIGALYWQKAAGGNPLDSDARWSEGGRASPSSGGDPPHGRHEAGEGRSPSCSRAG